MKAAETYLIESRLGPGAEKGLRDLAAVAKEVGEQIAGSGKQAAAGVEKIGSEADRSGDKTSKAGAVAARALAGVASAAKIAATALAATATGGLFFLGRAGLEAEELETKLRATFGAGAEAAKEAARDISDDYDRSFRASADALETFTGTFQQLGVQGRNLTDLSKQLSVAAFELAAFQGASDEDAIRSVNAAIAGQTDGLKKLGIILTKTELDAKLAARGIAGGAAAATEAQRALAVYSVILDRASEISGATADSSTRLSGILRSLSQQSSDLSQEFGAKLTQELASVIEGLGGVEGNADLLRSGFTLLFEVTKEFVGIAGEAAKAAKAIIEDLGGVEVIAGSASKAIAILGAAGRLAFISIRESVPLASIALESLRILWVEVAGAAEVFANIMGGGAALALRLVLDGVLLLADGISGLDRLLRDGLNQTLALGVGAFDGLLIAAKELDQFLGLGFSGSISETQGKLATLFEQLRQPVAEREVFGELREGIAGLQADLTAFAERRGQAAQKTTEDVAAEVEASGARISEAFVEIGQRSGVDFLDALGDILPGVKERLTEIRGLIEDQAKAASQGEAGDGLLAGIGRGAAEVAQQTGAFIKGLGPQLRALSADAIDAAQAQAEAAEQIRATQADNFEKERARLVGQLTLAYDEQIAELERWYEQELQNIDLMEAEGRLTSENADELRGYTSRLREQRAEQAKAEDQANSFFGELESGLPSIDGVSGALAKSVLGLDDAGQAWKRLAQTVVEAITQIAAKQAILAAVSVIPGLGGGGVTDGPAVPVTKANAGAVVSGSLNRLGNQFAEALGLPFNAYDAGGVLSSPQLFLAGEGASKEAIVPMPNGAVPVQFVNGTGTQPAVANISLQINAVDARSVERLFRENGGALINQLVDALNTSTPFRRAVSRAARAT